MVWGLFPVDPLPGEDKYYIFSKGTYKVGRKGCDIIINKDKGVSRIHAEILVDEMTSLEHQQRKSVNISSKIRIRDCSKYGTYINKNTGLKEKVHEFPNKETVLKDGDLVSFGTGNATYKLSFVSLTFLLQSTDPNDQFLQEKISSIGAFVTRKWSSQCTHVLVEDLIPLKEDLVDAIVARRPFARFDWVELIAGKSICTEIPSCISYAPTLTIEGASVKIADPQTRENCLRGYTFLLESTHKYKFKDRFQALLEVGGAKVSFLEAFRPNSQGVEDEGNNRVVLVIPTEFTSRSEGTCVGSLPRVTEGEMIFAVLCGHLDPSIISSPPVLVTSSCSTDETVVADSDTEIEAATSAPTYAMVDQIGSVEDDSKMMVDNHLVESAGQDSRGETDNLIILSTESDSKHEVFAQRAESTQYKRKVEGDTDTVAVNWSEVGHVTVSTERDGDEVEKKVKIEETESGNSDVIYSQKLIVKDINFPISIRASTQGAVINFKRFRKKGAPSGNSFSNLIPFSKCPYKESDCENDEVTESIKAEKKRKQMESIAEDLFKNQKARQRGAQRGVPGSLRELLSRG